MKVGIFNLKTGLAKQSIQCKSMEDEVVECNKREGYVLLECDDIESAYYSDGAVHYKGKAPSEAHVFDMESKSWKLHRGLLTRGLKQKRQKLLSECDWTQLQDVPAATKQSWRAYRQALRDITNQSGWPETVEWPLKPS